MKCLELKKRLADTIRNTDLSERRRNQLALWLDNQIDKRSVLAEEVSKESGIPIDFDAEPVARSPLLTLEFRERATRSMRALWAFEYATQLEECVEQHVAERLSAGREVDSNACATILNASQWIRFWTSKGFDFAPDDDLEFRLRR